MEQTIEHKTLTFKDVHLELEAENTLLMKEHNLSDFKNKAEFLSSIGFRNSMATKMYQAIVDSESYVKAFNERYHGMYKFILEEQLERVCEKYNLFVRPLNLFVGDIPEKNINDMMNFNPYIEDWGQMNKSLYNRLGEADIMINDVFEKLGFGINHKINLAELQDCLRKINVYFINRFLPNNPLIPRSGRNMPFNAELVIAATQNLFSPSAFENDPTRMGNENESVPTGFVDLDPIVMLRNAYGYIIITAWGDEANDELVANQNFN